PRHRTHLTNHLASGDGSEFGVSQQKNGLIVQHGSKGAIQHFTVTRDGELAPKGYPFRRVPVETFGSGYVYRWQRLRLPPYKYNADAFRANPHTSGVRVLQ